MSTDSNRTQPDRAAVPPHGRVARRRAYLFGVTALAIFVVGVGLSTRIASTYSAEAVIRQPRISMEVRQAPPATAQAIAEELSAPVHVAAALAAVDPSASNDATDAKMASPDPRIAAIRQRLSVRTSQSASSDWLRFSVTLSDTDPRFASAVVNRLVEHYARRYNHAESGDAIGPYETAVEEARRARRAALDAERDIDASLEAPDQPADSMVDPAPVVVRPEDPAVLAADGTDPTALLARLRTTREQMLQRLTVRHPEVRGLDARIAEVESEIERLEDLNAESEPNETIWAAKRSGERNRAAGDNEHPRNPIGDERSSASWAVQKQQRARARAIADQCELEVERARQMAERAGQPVVEIVRLAPRVGLPDNPARRYFPWLSFGLAVAVGGTTAMSARFPAAVFRTVRQVETTLGIPIVGTIAPTDPETATAVRKRNGGGNSAVSLVRIVSECTLLIVVGWFAYLAATEPGFVSTFAGDPMQAVAHAIDGLVNVVGL